MGAFAGASPAATAASTTAPVQEEGQQLLRTLARDGALADTYAHASSNQRMTLRGAAYTIAWPIVYDGVTRPREQLRGHPVCASGVNHLADECLDRFHDDAEAAVEDLLTHSRQPIERLEAWLIARLPRSTVDAHRRRRGERGALQRPRLTRWLRDELGHDPWLCALATNILVWAGVKNTAGTRLWPLEAWAQERGQHTGDWAGSDPAVVARDVETVLTVMRRRPQWYESYVERPLGAKQFPAVGGIDTAVMELGRPLDPTAVDDEGEEELQQRAHLAVATIRDLLRDGVLPTDAAATAVRNYFPEVLDQLGLTIIGQVVAAAAPNAGEQREPMKAFPMDGAAAAPRNPEPAEHTTARRAGRPRACPDDVLAAIVDARLRGERLVDICARFNQAGVPTPGGGDRWHPSYISKLMGTRDAQALLNARRAPAQPTRC